MKQKLEHNQLTAHYLDKEHTDNGDNSLVLYDKRRCPKTLDPSSNI